MDELIRTEYLEKLDAFRDRPDLVKILTGVRRSGKSTILSQFRRKLESEGMDVVYMDMERLFFAVTSDREMHRYISESMPSDGAYLLIDEVQFVKGWEKVVNSFRACGANVYVTGSNARVLSSDFTTIIGGRYIEIHVLPLSFREFLDRYPPEGAECTEQRFDQYLREGGLPVIDLRSDGPKKRRAIMDGVYDSIVGRDIAVRSGMDIGTIRRLTSYLYSNIGNIATGESLMKGSGISDRRTLEKYLDAVEDSYVFYRVDTYDLVGKKMMKIKAKYFSADVGLRNAALGHRMDDSSGLLENVVFLELKRRGYDIAVGAYRDYEVDFTARKDGDTEFFQIASTLSDESAVKREERPLRLLKEIGRKTILTMDCDLPEDSDGIRYVNLIDWLEEDDERTRWVDRRRLHAILRSVAMHRRRVPEIEWTRSHDR